MRNRNRDRGMSRLMLLLFDMEYDSLALTYLVSRTRHGVAVLCASTPSNRTRLSRVPDLSLNAS